MSVYKMKKRNVVGFYSIFGGLTLFFLTKLLMSTKLVFLLMSIISIFLTYLFIRLSKTTIITTDKTIRQNMFQGEQECAWDKIYKVRTVRSSTTGNNSTHISWATEPQYKDRIVGLVKKDMNSGVINVSDHFNNYVSLLKEVKERAINAEFDEATIKIITSEK